jgi:hypothetical protein
LNGEFIGKLFLDSAAEGILRKAKFHHYHAETEKEPKNPSVRQNAALIEEVWAAKTLHENLLKMFGVASA